jgi:hypothetical protein
MLTTLELTRAIATAARNAPDMEAATIAVLDTMHRTDSWFCARYENWEGLTVDVRYEQVKLPYERTDHAAAR